MLQVYLSIEIDTNDRTYNIGFPLAPTIEGKKFNSLRRASAIERLLLWHISIRQSLNTGAVEVFCRSSRLQSGNRSIDILIDRLAKCSLYRFYIG